MSTTVVNIRTEGNVLVPDPSQVAIASGDTVTFVVDKDTGATLAMDAGTANILSPRPDSLALTLAAGSRTTFQFTNPEPHAYCMFVVDATLPPPDQVQCTATSQSAVLFITPWDGSSFPVGDPPIQTST